MVAADVTKPKGTGTLLVKEYLDNCDYILRLFRQDRSFGLAHVQSADSVSVTESERSTEGRDKDTLLYVRLC